MARSAGVKNRYAPGVAMVKEITRAAQDVLVEQGHAALSLRAVAKECGLKLSNLSYYFPAKHHLIKAMLDSIIESYPSYGQSPEQIIAGDPLPRLKRALFATLRDNEKIRTSRIFIEIWSMANNDPHVREAMNNFYDYHRSFVARLVRAANPKLDEKEAAAIAFYAVSTMEGSMVFANKAQPAWTQMPRIAAFTVSSIMELVMKDSRDELDALEVEWRARRHPRRDKKMTVRPARRATRGNPRPLCLLT